MKRSAAIIVILCICLLCFGCQKETEAPAPTPRPLPRATPPPPVVGKIKTLPMAEDVSPIGQWDSERGEDFFTIKNWGDKKVFRASEGLVTFTGMQMDGSREGTSVTVNLHIEERDEYIRGEVAVSSPMGEEAVLSIYSMPKIYEGLCTLQLADLDGDGTDEILLFHELGAAHGEEDVHILRYEAGALHEIFTMVGAWDGDRLRSRYVGTLWNESVCNGAALFPVSGGFGLRVYVEWEGHNPNLHDIYAELIYEDGEWIETRELGVFAQEEQRAYIAALLQGLEPDAIAYAQVDTAGRPVSIPAGGEGILYMHYAQGNTPMGTYLLLEWQVAGKSSLLRAYEGMDAYAYAFADLDGDGGEELLLALSRGEAPNDRMEAHVFKPRRGGLEEVLTFFSAPSVREQKEYQDTLMLLPNGGSLPEVEVGAFNGAIKWAEVVPYNNGYAIEFHHVDELGNMVAKSRVAWVGRGFRLVEQGLVEMENPPEMEEIPSLMDADDEHQG